MSDVWGKLYDIAIKTRPGERATIELTNDPGFITLHWADGSSDAYWWEQGMWQLEPKGHWACTAHRRISIPSNQLTKLNPALKYAPIKGSMNELAVFNNDLICIGWISTATIGYPTVSDWINAGQYKDKALNL